MKRLFGIEGDRPPASLVEQETAEAEREIHILFDGPDAPVNLTIDKAVVLLSSPAMALARASHDLGWHKEIPAATFSGLSSQLRRGYHVSSKRRISYTLEQLLQLNNHSYTRTLDILKVAQTLDVSVGMIRGAVEELNIEPVAPAVKSKNPDTPWEYILNERFNKDQVFDVRDAVRIYAPPEDWLPESRVLAATRLAPAALYAILEKLEISPSAYHNFESGQGENYLPLAGIAKVIAYLRGSD